jgi:hypothetical protein
MTVLVLSFSRSEVMTTATRGNGSRIAANVNAFDALLEAMESATIDDLEKIKAQIADEEQQLETLVAARRRNIDSLSKLADIIDLRLHGKPKIGRPAAGGAGLSPLRRKIKNWLLDQDGPQKPSAIAEGLGRRLTSVYTALQHPAFKKEDDGFLVAEQTEVASQGSAE